MLFTDYINDTRANVANALDSGEYDYCEDAEAIFDDMWVDDSITGNASGSYTFCTATARENVGELIFDEDFTDALADLGMTVNDIINDGPESVDVTARCLALYHCGDIIDDFIDARADI